MLQSAIEHLLLKGILSEYFEVVDGCGMEEIEIVEFEAEVGLELDSFSALVYFLDLALLLR